MLSRTRPPFRVPIGPRLVEVVAVLLAVLAALAVVRPAEAAPAPTVTAVSPALGPSAGGTSITITGTGFVAGAGVTVGGVAATSVSVVSATSITAVTPAGTPGLAVVTVTNADTQAATLSGAFTYQYPAPTTSLVAPATGTSAGGTSITITGTQFRAGATVTVGGSAATNVVVASATSITATTPPRPIGAASIVVANNDGQSATLASAFTYTAAAAPTVTSAAPTSGSVGGGTSITITGTGFVAGATVTIGGVTATGVSVASATSITATTPAGAATGAVAIAVANPDTQTGIAANAFTYTPRPAPTISNISPATGGSLGGTSVTVTGTNFVTGATLTIGGVAAASTVVSATSITATTPQHASGATSVVVTNPDGQSVTLTNGYTFSANSAPTSTGIAPSTGTTNGGDFFTITGTNFLAGATVLFGGTPATQVSIPNSTTITGYTPAKSAGTATVMVQNYDGQTLTISGGFGFQADAAPTIASVSPNAGPIAGGTLVTITGTGYKTNPTVTIGGFGVTPYAVSTTSIKLITPPGVAGKADVVVTNADGQTVTSTGGFAFESAAPSVTGITPDSGPIAGGTVVTITGSGFEKGATVTFGTVAATSVVVNSSTEITATAPVQATAGMVDVLVRNATSAAATLSSGFSYRAGGAATVGASPPPGGIVIVIAGTTELQALISAQKFTVTAVYRLDVAKQAWQTHIVGAPASVNNLTALKATDIVLLRR
jgi:hypothetical protein